MSTNFDVGNGRPSGDRRQRPEQVRRAAIEVAQRLFAERGPSGITLKLVGSELGMTHANLIHHFGSAEAFQTQLVNAILQDLTRNVTTLIHTQSQGDANLRTIVDVVFDAYGVGGAGALLAWAQVNGNGPSFAGLAQEMGALVLRLETMLSGSDAPAQAREMIALVTSMALTDSLIGPPLARILDEDPGKARDRAVRLLERLLSAQGQ